MRWFCGLAMVSLILSACNEDDIPSSPTAAPAAESVAVFPSFTAANPHPTDHLNWQYNYTTLTWDQCNSELVFMEGGFHSIINMKYDDSGSLIRYGLTSTGRWTGIGTTSGRKYQFMQGDHQVLDVPDDGPGYRWSVDTRFRVIAQGAAADYSLRSQYTVTYDPSTGWSVDQKKFEFECR